MSGQILQGCTVAQAGRLLRSLDWDHQQVLCVARRPAQPHLGSVTQHCTIVFITPFCPLYTTGQFALGRIWIMILYPELKMNDLNLNR